MRQRCRIWPGVVARAPALASPRPRAWAPPRHRPRSSDGLLDGSHPHRVPCHGCGAGPPRGPAWTDTAAGPVPGRSAVGTQRRPPTRLARYGRRRQSGEHRDASRTGRPSATRTRSTGNLTEGGSPRRTYSRCERSTAAVHSWCSTNPARPRSTRRSCLANSITPTSRSRASRRRHSGAVMTSVSRSGGAPFLPSVQSKASLGDS